MTDREFWRPAAACVVAILLLAAFRSAPLPPALDRIRDVSRQRGLSAEALELQTTGYYQELLDSSSRAVAPTPTALNMLLGGDAPDKRKPTMEELAANQVPIHERLEGFLIYRPRPNLDIVDPRYRDFRYVTNSLGFADREYPYERAPDRRRIVVLGDSMAGAVGANIGFGFEALLEEELNRNSSGQRYELINMGVAGYRMTQVVEVARTVAPRFKPDVYVWVVTWLTASSRWGLHLAQLVEEQRDLKYDYLREVVKESGLKRGDTVGAVEAKLRTFMEQTLRWSIREVRAQAARDGASFIVVLMPHLNMGDSAALFARVQSVLRGERVPHVDLLDAFDGRDVSPLDAGDGAHPNAEGHRILFDVLRKRIAENAAISTLLGQASPPGPVEMAPVGR